MVEMAGIEPAAATLAGRARYLSCHPRPAGFGIMCSGLPFHGVHAMDMSITQPVERLYGTANSSRCK